MSRTYYIEKVSNLWCNAKCFAQKYSIGKDWISEVSLLALLTNRSGLSYYLDSYDDGLTVPKSLNKPISSIELLGSISFDVTKKHLYSNSNYLLVGKLIEEINRLPSIMYLIDSLNFLQQ